MTEARVGARSEKRIPMLYSFFFLQILIIMDDLQRSQRIKQSFSDSIFVVNQIKVQMLEIAVSVEEINVNLKKIFHTEESCDRNEKYVSNY